MIAKIKGKIDEIKPTGIIIDVNGLGYYLSIPFSTYQKIKNDSHCELKVHTYVREDMLKLYGFYTEKEIQFFEILIKISGIGPSMALSILSGISVDELTDCVSSNDISRLVAIPGIGKTKAEKLIFELKRKLKSIINLNVNSKGNTIVKDAVEALITLGYDEHKSTICINSILNSNSDIKIEDLIKKSLVILAK